MNEIRFPKKLEVTCMAENNPVSGMIFVMILKMKRKNDYSIAFGPTDSRGITSISEKEILYRVESLRNHFLMDYGDPHRDSAGEIVVFPMSLQDVDQALRAYELFQGTVDYPTHWKNDLLHARKALQKLPPRTPLSVDIQHDGSNLKIVTQEKPGK